LANIDWVDLSIITTELKQDITSFNSTVTTQTCVPGYCYTQAASIHAKFKL